MAINWILVLRAEQLILSIIILGLSAYVVNWYTMETRTSSPSQVNFLVAAPVLSLVSLAYTEGSSRFAPRFYKQYAALAVDAFNTLMYFAGFIALAVFLNGLLFCRGNVCRSARAAAVFSAMSFSVWAGSTVLLSLSVFRGSRKPSMRTQAMYAAEMKDAASRA